MANCPGGNSNPTQQLPWKMESNYNSITSSLIYFLPYRLLNFFDFSYNYDYTYMRNKENINDDEKKIVRLLNLVILIFC